MSLEVEKLEKNQPSFSLLSLPIDLWRSHILPCLSFHFKKKIRLVSHFFRDIIPIRLIIPYDQFGHFKSQYQDLKLSVPPYGFVINALSVLNGKIMLENLIQNEPTLEYLDISTITHTFDFKLFPRTLTYLDASCATNKLSDVNDLPRQLITLKIRLQDDDPASIQWPPNLKVETKKDSFSLIVNLLFDKLEIDFALSHVWKNDQFVARYS